MGMLLAVGGLAVPLTAEGAPLWREAPRKTSRPPLDSPEALTPTSSSSTVSAPAASASAQPTPKITRTQMAGREREIAVGAEPSLPEFRKVVARARHAVASISTLERTGGKNPLNGVVPAPIDAEQQKGLGSGFFIHPDGYLVTNAHVVEDVLGIRVFIPREGGWREFPARILGLDRFTDVALLKVDGDGFEFETLPLGDSDALEVAEWVAAVGNPFGLRHSVSLGIISFKGRNDVKPAGREGYFDYLQTDTAINPGNSGGPLINQRGEVVGIANAVNAVGQGIGFAIPINLAKAVLYPLLLEGRVRRCWLGIRVDALTPGVIRSLDLLPDQRGVIVSQVLSGSPCDRAGLKKGDLILSYGGQSVDEPQSLRWWASLGKAGDRVALAILRDGQPQTLSLELMDSPEETTALWKGAQGALGITARGVGVPRARADGLSVPIGAEVVSVAPGSRADKGGLIAGDLLLKVDETLLLEPRNLAAIFEKLDNDAQAEPTVLRVVVRRSGKTIFLAL
ncbi:MAG: trypsin-like peptidase domain-containing protein [Myxococcales bacterium]|jgi:serine protease Do|nr:trypsin-like peptidase domain-containing protein [Myxococcales bacterium]